jgi:hypothetical protein
LHVSGIRKFLEGKSQGACKRYPPGSKEIDDRFYIRLFYELGEGRLIKFSCRDQTFEDL